VFDARYRNDETGALAYHPGVLLKVVLLGYARGLTSSRSIERACRENIVFMALSCDSAPHFTTIAGFVAKLPGDLKLPRSTSFNYFVAESITDPSQRHSHVRSARNSQLQNFALIRWAFPEIRRAIACTFASRSPRCRKTAALSFYSRHLTKIIAAVLSII